MADPVMFKLGSVLASYPVDESFLEVARLFAGKLGDLPALHEEKLAACIEELDAGALVDLRSDYIDLFDRGRAANPVYETEYGRDRVMVKGHDLADIAAFYKAFGLGWEEGEMVDHVAIELEFYAWLSLKEAHLQAAGETEGVQVVQDARKKFLADHLGRFAPAIAARPAIQAHPFYGPVLQFCARIVEDECRDMGVTVEPLSYLPGQKEPEMMCCGGLAPRSDG